jgi:hypothetical protein
MCAKLHGVITDKIILFNVTAVRTSSSVTKNYPRYVGRQTEQLTDCNTLLSGQLGFV